MLDKYIMSGWTDLVQKIYNENRHKKGFNLENAMKIASPIWKKSKKNSISKMTETKKGSRRKKRSSRRH